MPYTVICSTIQEVADGAVLMPVRLGESLLRRIAEFSQANRTLSQKCEVEIYNLGIIDDQDEFNALVNNFGVEPMIFMFLNECAVRACAHFNIPINPIGNVNEPPRHSSLLLRHLFVW
jgi:hypothetical protein